MKCSYWVKFDNEDPTLWRRDSFEAFWHDLREFMLRHPRRLEWMIQYE